MTSLKDRAALVTGGGTGIGAAIADAFAAAGAAVAVTGRRAGPLDDTVRRIKDSGGAALAVPADVTDLDAMGDAVEKTTDAFGRLDIVVANAGIALIGRPILEYEPEEWRQVLDTDLTGVWNTAKAAAPALIRTGGGSFVVIGSGLARVTGGGAGPYAVAKAGAGALTRLLSAELREHQIAVNELIPGPTATAAIGDDEAARQRWKARGEWYKQPEDVARLALFVATLPPGGPTGQVFSLAARLL
jgi:NAD(P)-dependent dehydrogenase (short-subunit alcohol dehydrogenase family)